MKGSGLYQTIANAVFGSKLRDGEIHAPQYTKNGFTMASYMGPGTDLYHNITKGKKPVSMSDMTSFAHDLRYDAATTPEDVRKADLKMVSTLEKINKEGKDYKFNLYMGLIPIKLKMAAEDWGLLKKGSFSSLTGVDEKNKKLHDSKLRELEMKGYGLKYKKNLLNKKYYK